MNYYIGNEAVYGLERAVKASGNPMRTKLDTGETTEKDYLRADRLGATRNGEGHDNFLKGITASQCVEETDPYIIKRVKELIDAYNLIPEEKRDEKKAAWRVIVASLPCGFCLGATMVTNYQQLKTMYYQRRDHKLKEWHVFCDWCLSLPRFKELLGIKD